MDGARGRSGPAAEAAADGQETHLTALARLLFRAAQDASAGTLSAGVGRACANLGDLPQAAAEARDALRIGRRVHGDGKLVSYADLGLYRLLHILRDSAELRTFYEQTLGPLADYDRRTGQNLIETLEVFFECHGNLSQTAQRLHHHRNSLLYRVGRIQEISGLDLEDPEARLSLQVALKARRLLL
jgi:purine catabolism regulator